MYSPPNSFGANAYAKVGKQSSAMSASPRQLITMLFDGAKAAIAMARHQMSVGNLAAKSSSISKAINIVENGLKASLDFEAGGSDGAELASNLSVFYDYIVRQLLLANLRNDQNLLVEVDRLLENIGSAWREVDIRLTAQKASVATLATRISVGV